MPNHRPTDGGEWGSLCKGRQVYCGIVATSACSPYPMDVPLHDCWMNGWKNEQNSFLCPTLPSCQHFTLFTETDPITIFGKGCVVLWKIITMTRRGE